MYFGQAGGKVQDGIYNAAKKREIRPMFNNSEGACVDFGV